MEDALQAPLPADPEETQAAPIRFKPVPYWPRSPDSWFIALEAQFAVNRITSDTAQFYLTLQSLDEKAIQTCRDVVTRPPEAGKYLALKKAILTRLGESEDSRLTRVIHDLDLGDKRPSELFRDMQNLAEDQISNAVLKKLWLQRLPSQMQAILAVSTENIDVLIKLADQIDISLKPSSCHSVANSTTKAPEYTHLPTASSEFDELKHEMSEIKSQLSAVKANSVKKNRCAHCFQSNAARKNTASNICWYHQRFGENAIHCTSPCSFSGNASGPVQ